MATMAATLVVSVAWSPAIADTDDHTRWNLKAVDEFIVPGYRDLAAAAAALANSASDYCGAPGGEGLEALRARFNDTMDAWQSIQVIRFGAIDLELRWQRVQFWPDEHDITGRHLHELRRNPDPDALEPRAFRAGSVAVQGLGALERLLYAGEGSDHEAPICPILTAITANLASIGRQVVSEWTGGDEPFRELVANAASGNTFFDDPADVAGHLLGDLRTALEIIAHRKIGAPLGESPDETRPRQAESWRSGRSLANIRLNLQSIGRLYRIAFGPRIAGSELDQRIRASLTGLERLAADTGRPLTELVEDPAGRETLERMRDETVALDRMVSAELSAALGITIGFNSMDGD